MCNLNGMLELVSLNGNIVSDDSGKLYHHTHAAFAPFLKREYLPFSFLPMIASKIR